MGLLKAMSRSLGKALASACTSPLLGDTAGGLPPPAACSITLSGAGAGALGAVAADISGQTFSMTEVGNTSNRYAGMTSAQTIASGARIVECINTFGDGPEINYFLASADTAKILQADYVSGSGQWAFALQSPLGNAVATAFVSDCDGTEVVTLGVDADTGDALIFIDGEPVTSESMGTGKPGFFTGKTQFALLGLLDPSATGQSASGTFRTNGPDYAYPAVVEGAADWCGNALGSSISCAYPLDDDGTNASGFGASLLETLAPAHVRAQHTFSAPEEAETLIATPADIPSSLVPFADGETRVVGFKINSVPPTGGYDLFFQLYNAGAPSPVLVHASVNQDAEATSGTVDMGAGVFPGGPFGGVGTPVSVADLAGCKVAVELTYVDGEVVGRVHCNGTVVGTSAAFATSGGFIPIMQVQQRDASPVGELLDVEMVTSAADLSVGFGTFAEGALDLCGNTIGV